MLSKSLIQFSVDRQGCVPSLLFGLRSNYDGVMKVILTSLKRTCALLYSVLLTLQQATVDPCLHQRLLDTHRQVWFSVLWGHCSFLLAPNVHKVLFVPSKSPQFPQSCGSSVIKSHWPPKSNSLGVLSPFARSSGWETCHGS